MDAVTGEPGAAGIRLAELIASLSLAIDLGFGLPGEQMLKSALVAVRLAKACGLDEDTQRAAYYLAMVRLIGCTSTATGDAEMFGDETNVPDLMFLDFDDMPAALSVMFRNIGPGRSAPRRAAMMARFMMAGRGAMIENHMRHCEGGAILCSRMGLDEEVQAGLWHTYERWDGKGSPNGVAGEAIRPAARIVHIAALVPHFHALGGAEGAVAVVGSRAGRQLDPAMARVFAETADDLLAGLEASQRETVLQAEPGAGPVLADEGLETALEAVADFVDQKTPSSLGHSRRVAALVELGRAGIRAAGRRHCSAAPRRAGSRAGAHRRQFRHPHQVGAADGGRMGAGAHAPLFHREDPVAVADAGAAGGSGGAASRAA